MLAECFGAEVLRMYNGAIVVMTDPVVAPTHDLLDQITGQNVLIVGGYYRGKLSEFLAVAKSVTVFYNTSDTPDDVEHLILKASPNRGFASYAVETANTENKELLMKIAVWLDEYLYGFPSENSLKFQNGVYTLDAKTDVEKVKLIMNGTWAIEDVLDVGAVKRHQNLVVARERLEEAREYTVLGKKVLVAIGGSPIVDSCILLSQRTGIGMLVRYDQQKKRTFVSCRVTEASGEDAGAIMHAFINGGGSRPMGGGSIDGILSLDELFSR